MAYGTEIPEPALEHQKLLKALIADIPGPGGGQELKSGSPAVSNPTKDLIAANAPYKTNERFKILTGYEHVDLLKKWLHDRTTTCNEFVGTCARRMGWKGEENIGRFDIAERLLLRGLGHVWVPGTSDATPEFGDIFRLYEAKPDHNGVSLNHMAISLHVSGTTWYTVESGQGGPLKGYDAICRKIREWKPGSLRGWVSMRALLNSGKPVPNWLGGWWEITEGPYETYYYHFGAGGKVTYTTRKPTSVGQPAPADGVKGTFSMKGMYGIEISWHTTGDVDESLTLSGQDMSKRKFTFSGKTARGVKLDGTRMLGKSEYI